ncbi:MAG TPA: efflux RND transporter permease subunit [Caulobacteraceae bacterium]|nr:efflux RND transporter permease subunit [Caulobacteraceae bacterium]
MLSTLIRGSLRRPWLILVACLVFLAYGAQVVRGEKLDVFPDISSTRASVETEAPGMVAEQVEQLVTRPLENSLIGAAGVAAIHSRSTQGLSLITLEFQPGAEPGRVRQVISERMAQGASALPAGAGPPRLSPLTSTSGDILTIGFTSDRLTPMALRSIVQWTVRPRLLSVPAIANVEVFGGEVRRIEVQARSGDLSDSDLGYADVFDAVRRATGVTGAGFIDTPTQRVLIEPRGQALTLDDVAAGQIQIVGSAPTRISDVADVVDAAAPAIGDALVMGKPAVLVRIAAQHGANTLDATRAAEAAIALLRPALAQQGVHVEADLDRPATFIGGAIGEILWDVAIGAALVLVLLILMLRDWRAALVSIISIPLSLCAAVLVLNGLGWTLNSMTLGGLAVALGLVVDDAVIDVENIVARLREAESRHTSRAEALLAASLEVRAPVIYATAIIVVGLVPLVFVGGAPGELLRPMAVSIIVASLASLIVAMVVTPALANLLLQHIGPDQEPAILHRLKVGYDGMLARVMSAPRALVLAAAALLLAGALLVFSSFSSEFLPDFHGGHLTADITAPASTSLAVMRDYGQRITRDLLANPNISRVSEQIGRAEAGADAFGPDHAQFDIALKPRLTNAAQDSVERRVLDTIKAYPGLHAEVHARFGAQIFGAPARGRIEVRIFGNDLDALDTAAAQVAAALQRIPGAQNVQVAASGEAPAVRVDLDFQRLAIYGLSASDVLDTVQTAFAGRKASQIYENGRAIDIAVTAQARIRQDPEGVGDLLLRSSSGVSVPLKTVANVYLADGRSVIEHDNGLRRQIVSVDVKGDAGDFIRRAKDRVNRDVALPPGLYLEFPSTDGEGPARREVLTNIALAGFGMLALMMLAFGNPRSGALILVSTTFAFIGGVGVVALMGGVMTLGALAGFIALFALSTRSAVLLVSRIDDLVIARKRPWSVETARLAARQRLWPIMVGALLVAAALTPLALRSDQPGQEILGPMVLVILGGLATSTLMSLFVTPVLAIQIWRPRPGPQGPSGPPEDSMEAR